MLDRFPNLFGRVYAPTFWGSVRICVFTSALLVAVVRFMPPHDYPIPWDNVSEPKNVIMMLREQYDPEGFRRPGDFMHNGAFRIAWVSGSSTQVLYPLNVPGVAVETNEFMPMFLTDKLSALVGRKVQIELYVIQAGSILDKYLAIINAIESKPDMLILALNPVYDFSPVVLSWRRNLFATNTRNSFKNDRFLRMAFIASPSAILGSLASEQCSWLKNRRFYSDVFELKIHSYLKFEAVVRAPAGLMAKLNNEAHAPIFWSRHGRNSSTKSYPLGASFTGIQAALFRAKGSTDSPAQTVKRWIVEELESTSIPALVYLAPVRYETHTNSVFAPIIASLKENTRQNFSGITNSCVVTDFSQEFHQTLVFNDEIHLRRSEPMASAMYDILAAFIMEHKCLHAN